MDGWRVKEREDVKSDSDNEITLPSQAVEYLLHTYIHESHA